METSQALRLFFRRKQDLLRCGSGEPVGEKEAFSVFGGLEPIELFLTANHGKVLVLFELAHILPDEP